MVLSSGTGARPRSMPTKSPQHRRFIQRILRARVAQVEPLLQKIHPQHDAQSHRRPSILSLRIVRFHQRL